MQTTISDTKKCIYLLGFARRIVCLLALLVTMCAAASAQQSGNARKAITSEFAEKEITFDNSSIISNVLKIRNNNPKPYKLMLQVNVPGNWKKLLSENKIYEIGPNDSLFVPVRVVPNFKNVSGSTKYSINVVVLSADGRVMSTSFFFADKPVISNWQMKILPKPRIYFLNEEYTAKFQVDLSNDGDEAIRSVFC